MHSYDLYSDWLEHDGKIVNIHGINHRLRCSCHNAIYPYAARLVSVSAEPCNRRSEYYLNERRKLGDDWSVDVLASDVTLQSEIMMQLAD